MISERSKTIILAMAILGGTAAIPQIQKQIPPNGLEGLSSKPYRDIGGVWTDCYGNTKDVNRYLIRSKEECNYLLSDKVNSLYDQIISVTEPDNKYTAAYMISFAYNVGFGAFKRSTLLKLYNTGKKLDACHALFKWVYVDGKYSQGLYNRRKIEYQICLMGQRENIS